MQASRGLAIFEQYNLWVRETRSEQSVLDEEDLSTMKNSISTPGVIHLDEATFDHTSTLCRFAMSPMLST
jgi:hypothetical protein